MPSGSDTWAYERQRLARRRRRERRRRRMLWLLTGVTTVVLLFIALMIRDMAKLPTTARTAALSASARPAVKSSAHASPRPRGHARTGPAAAPSYPRVTDSASGLSYWQFSSPWRRGCPSALDTPVFSWSDGENAVAGQVVIGGSTIDWHANACSGQLQPQFNYSGPADLQTTATSLVGAVDPAYYAGIEHSLAITGSSAMQVSGNQAWAVRFVVTYSGGVSQGLTWTTESGAVVVVDRGQLHVPAVFYVSVPGDLDTSDVDTLISSLRLTS
jgi:hypothetical protein